MQFHTLTNTMFSIEKMVGSEGQPAQLLIQLHKLSKQITSFVRMHQSAILQNKQNQKEKQQLKKKLKKTTAKLEKKQEECQQLQCELIKIKDVYEHKLNKLIKFQEKTPRNEERGSQKVRQRKVSSFNKSKDIQCQILNESLVKELQEKNIGLLRKISILEEELRQQKNQNNSKQLYIQSLLSALDSEIEENLESDQDVEPETATRDSSCQDRFDVSTIDADSLKDEDHQTEFFPEGQKKIWHENELEGSEHCEKWYSSMFNAFKKAKVWLWRL